MFLFVHFILCLVQFRFLCSVDCFMFCDLFEFVDFVVGIESISCCSCRNTSVECGFLLKAVGIAINWFNRSIINKQHLLNYRNIIYLGTIYEQWHLTITTTTRATASQSKPAVVHWHPYKPNNSTLSRMVFQTVPNRTNMKKCAKLAKALLARCSKHAIATSQKKWWQ